MSSYILLLICGILLRFEYGASVDVQKIPKSLSLGTASSAYQIEGAWNEEGKGENIWDRFTRTQSDKIIDGSSGNIACNAYHTVDEDVALLKDLGVDHYHFSISWSRVLPSGFANEINEAGVNYYNKLIDALIANNIKPIATLYHFDLPQPLQDLGGAMNPDIAEWFKDYARVAFGKFGDRVKTWVTVNEPRQVCQYAYERGIFAPGISSSGIGVYICAHNVIKAHAHVYHVYDKEFRPTQKGRIGITNECTWSEPATNSTADIAAAERRRQFEIGLYVHPIFHRNGDYPQLVKRAVAERSKLEGFPTSRLPKFTPDEVKFVKGTYDFFGLNHFTTFYARDKEAELIGIPAQNHDMRVESLQETNWLTGVMPYFKLVPWGTRKLLNHIKDTYDNPIILITASGFPDFNDLDDTNRIRFYKETLQEVLNAIYYDNVKVHSFTAWSFLDSFQWSMGYRLPFGFYKVNFGDSTRPRTPRSSATFFKNLLSTRRL